MIKKTLLIVSLIMLSFMVSACSISNTSKIVSTNDKIYNFYCDALLETQNNIGIDINKISLNTENKNRINSVLSNINLVSKEELAIIASIECYDMASTPKVLYLDITDGIVYVKQQGKTYMCNVKQNNVEANYEFSITKNSTTQEYNISYEKQIVNQNELCKANVFFDKQTSKLSIELETYDDISGQKFEIRKECYSLINSNRALRVNIVKGTSNNRSIYVIDTYKQIINFKTKIASCNDKSENIKIEDINQNKFVSSSSTDNCGYIFEYSAESSNPTVETFGDLSQW